MHCGPLQQAHATHDDVDDSISAHICRAGWIIVLQLPTLLPHGGVVRVDVRGRAKPLLPARAEGESCRTQSAVSRGAGVGGGVLTRLATSSSVPTSSSMAAL